MRISAKGRVTIPAKIREKAGLLPNTEVELILERGAVRIVRKEPVGRQSRGESLVQLLRGSATVRMSTDEILALTRRP